MLPVNKTNKSSSMTLSQWLFWLGVLVSVPRYAGAFLIADVGELTGLASEVLTAVNILGGVGMGLMVAISSGILWEMIGKERVFYYRQVSGAKEQFINPRFIIVAMFGGVIALLEVVIVVPYILSRVNHLPVTAVLGKFWLGGWAVAVAVAPVLMVAGVVYASRVDLDGDDAPQPVRSAKKGVGEIAVQVTENSVQVASPSSPLSLPAGDDGQAILPPKYSRVNQIPASEYQYLATTPAETILKEWNMPASKERTVYNWKALARKELGMDNE